MSNKSTPKKQVLVRIHRDDVRYPILILDNIQDLNKIFSKFGLIRKKVDRRYISRRACLLIDQGFERVRPEFTKILTKLYPERTPLYLSVPGSESSKSFETAENILGQMINAGLTRQDLCVAVGGGVTGDLGGFVASLYNRGIDVVHIPTTLLAMVDSSIGGKTAVNHSQGKNLVGSFHQPAAIINILEFIQSLSENDFMSGLGEVFKYAVGFKPALFLYLSQNSKKILARDCKIMAYIVAECIAIKSNIIAWDERETGRSKKTDRRLLNLGHTLGHGLEKEYQLPHGVAVAIGVTLAVKFSTKVKLCPQRCYTQVMELAHKLGLKTEADIQWSLDAVLKYVKHDKKVVGDQIQFIGIKKIGHAVVRTTSFKELQNLES